MRKILLFPLFCSLAFAQMGGTANMGGTATLGGGSGPATWTTLTNTCINQGSSGGTTCTWSTAVTSGQSQLCYVYASVASATFTVTDSNSDAFAAVGSPFTWAVGTATGQFFWFPKATTTITTVTATPSPAGNFPVVACQAATDSGASPATDGSQCTGTATSGSTYTCSAALTLAAQDYVMAYASAQGTATYTAGTGFTLGNTLNTAAASEYGLFSTSVTPFINNGFSGTGGIVAQAFRP
jgi:hypothetical protein